MAAAAHQRDGVVDHDGAAAGKDVVERHSLGAADQDVGQIPERDEPLLARQLRVEHRRVERVRPGLPVEPAEPRHPLRGVAGLADAPQQDERPDRAHGAARHRIADQHLVGPARGSSTSSQSCGAVSRETARALNAITAGVRYAG